MIKQLIKFDVIKTFENLTAVEVNKVIGSIKEQAKRDTDVKEKEVEPYLRHVIELLREGSEGIKGSYEEAINHLDGEVNGETLVHKVFEKAVISVIPKNKIVLH